MLGELIYQKPLFKYLSFRLEAPDEREMRTARRRLLAVTGIILLGVAAAPFLVRWFLGEGQFVVDVPKHANLEIFCGLISIIISFILYSEYSGSGKPSVLCIVLAFLSMGILDIFHALADHDHNTFVWFHSFSAFFGAVFFSCAIIFQSEESRFPPSAWSRRIHAMLGACGILLFAYLSERLGPFLPNVLTFDMPVRTSVLDAHGTFSAFIYGLNVLSGILFLGTGLFFLVSYFATNDIVFLVFATSSLLFFESEMLFAFSKLWDPIWWYWHFIKVIVFSGLLLGLAFGFTKSTQKLHASRKELRGLLNEIEEKNRQLSTAFERLKETQKYLKESEKLASIGKVAASLAHEIRNPLGAISNSIGVFRRYTRLDEESLELVTIIDNEIDRLDNLVEDFICYSGPVRLRLEAANIHAIIDETLTVFSMNPGMHPGIHLRKELAAAVPDFFLDKGRIKQILLNVLNNALEAMPHGGRITILTVYKAGDRELDVRITDSGEGISKQLLSQIFEPFFSTKDRGMGLGLNIVHNIIKAHHGYFSIASTPGSGTEVQISLPVNTKMPDSAGNGTGAGAGAVAGERV